MPRNKTINFLREIITRSNMSNIVQIRSYDGDDIHGDFGSYVNKTNLYVVTYVLFGVFNTEFFCPSAKQAKHCVFNIMSFVRAMSVNASKMCGVFEWDDLHARVKSTKQPDDLEATNGE